jgi:hypothetical protein
MKANPTLVSDSQPFSRQANKGPNDAAGRRVLVIGVSVQDGFLVPAYRNATAENLPDDQGVEDHCRLVESHLALLAPFRRVQKLRQTLSGSQILNRFLGTAIKDQLIREASAFRRIGVPARRRSSAGGGQQLIN